MISPSMAAKHLCKVSGWRLSNLQLQKMLYMADMIYTGTNQERLIDEDFEAWDYGPVIPSLYHRCKSFGSKPVPDIFWGVRNIDDTDEAEIIEDAWHNLRGRTPGQLVENTHWEHGAWAKHYAPGARGITIPTGDMIEEYQRRVR